MMAGARASEATAFEPACISRTSRFPFNKNIDVKLHPRDSKGQRSFIDPAASYALKPNHGLLLLSAPWPPARPTPRTAFIMDDHAGDAAVEGRGPTGPPR